MSTTHSALASIALVATLLGQFSPVESPRTAALEKMRAAKTVYFDDQAHVASVSKNARKELKKWGRYKLVDDRTQADLILLFSQYKYEGGYEVHPGGPTGATNIHGQSQEGLAPSYVRNGPAIEGFLTAIDPKTGEALWSESHQWGGLLTGFDSVGVRLIKRFKKTVK